MQSAKLLNLVKAVSNEFARASNTKLEYARATVLGIKCELKTKDLGINACNSPMVSAKEKKEEQKQEGHEENMTEELGLERVDIVSVFHQKSETYIDWNDEEPVMFTANSMKFLKTLNNNDTVICIDGSQLFSANQKLGTLTMFGAYKDSLALLVLLPKQPPKFVSDGSRLIQKYLDKMNINSKEFLWPEKEKLFKHILQIHGNALISD
ncbi:uncharacterized protein PHACADRAFT_26485 [Phanerochaete carnosa HHB-10118-sp]|uniref:Uncharacterized protein n=1 Tax=Phanerochaete carnosa (strain HHB-10118-sp) TaxID=650164 RepID=K5V5I7_PHACS|nr:uncharacterized protein PHACADRAFT_26485 [Phanerochaete carnosa HHB-10118-sp]EKM57911.1 hypothetical protein PHACADRAFT_26485 [Phanerochaete carnosa HHB-10118-sp]